jgi:hypothetical protein
LLIAVTDPREPLSANTATTGPKNGAGEITSKGEIRFAMAVY